MNIDQEFIQKIKAELEEKREKVLKELSAITETESLDTKKSQAVFPDRGATEDENAQEVAAYSDNLSLERALKDSLKDIEKALTAIQDGSYGTCMYCGQPIDAKRLLARPTSSSCIECKKRLKGED